MELNPGRSGPAHRPLFGINKTLLNFHPHLDLAESIAEIILTPSLGSIPTIFVS